MADPFGLLLSLLLLAASAEVYALNTALPCVDETELEEKDDAHSRRILRLLRRFDHGYGEIRMTYILLLFCAFITLLDTLMPVFDLGAVRTALILLVLFGIPGFTLTALIPGGIAAHAPEKALRFVALPAEIAILIASVCTLPAYWIGKAVLAPFHILPASAAEHVSEAEIRQMVDIGEDKGEIDADEKEMIENIFEFDKMDAGDCMVHRIDITAIDVESDDAEVLSTIRESGRSRFPVYEDTIDNIIGILTSRDFLLSRASGQAKPLRALIRPAYFVPESVRTDILFSRMQARKQHMAVVIDEYGGTSGLITLEDLIEEIVGNIYDEFDPKEEQDITPLPDGRWRVSGGVELEALGEALDIIFDGDEDEEYDTLGGLVFSRLTEIPADGEKPVITACGLRISVTEIADRRVEWAIVEKLSEPDHEEDAK